MPTVEHALMQCVDCGTDEWMGPNQRTAGGSRPQAILVRCLAQLKFLARTVRQRVLGR